MKALCAIVGVLLTLPGLLFVLRGMAGTPHSDGFGDAIALMLGFPMVLFGAISLFVAYSINRRETAEAQRKADGE